MEPIIAVLGLGEAGARLALDLAAAGVEVRGYDPRRGVELPGVARAPDPASAVAGAQVVLSVNSAAAARAAAEGARPALGSGSVFADLNTASPSLKRELAALVGGDAFADVALLGPVPVRGLRTPALASGAGRPCVRRRAPALRHAGRGRLGAGRRRSRRASCFAPCS